MCLNTLCPDDPTAVQTDMLDDTGYQIVIWKDAPGTADCSLVNHDNDGNTNDCLVPIPSRSFKRTYQSTGAPICTRRLEDGCGAGDNWAFWARSGVTESFTWDWLAQDYPHDDVQGHYVPSSTTDAYVRLWLHREKEPDLRRANSFSAPKTLKKVANPGWVVRGPVYDLKIYRWWLATPSDPWGELGILTPIARDVEEVPDGWDWLPDVDTAATRVLAVTAFSAAGATTQGTQPSVFYGELELAFDTTGFGAARFEEATFAFGGQNAHGELSAGFWMGFSEGASYAWQPVTGAMGLMASSGGTSPAASTAPLGGKTKSVPIPPSKSYAAWLAKTKKKLGISRAPLVLLAAQHKSAFDAAMVARATIKKTPAKQVKLASSPAPAAPLATRSFGSGAPQPQKHAAVVGNREQMLVAILFGELERPRSAGDPVPVALWDLDSSEWIVGEVEWSCGPRYAVGYTASSAADRAIIFYGGKLGSEVVDGLYRKALSPDALFDGSDVTRLDAVEGGPPRPGPRTDAALAYEPQNRFVYLFGGTDENGIQKNDLWVFSEKTTLWTLLSSGQEPNAPAAALAAGIAISPLDGSPVVIGGSVAQGNTAAFWRWRNGAWRIERVVEE